MEANEKSQKFSPFEQRAENMVPSLEYMGTSPMEMYPYMLKMAVSVTEITKRAFDIEMTVIIVNSII